MSSVEFIIKARTRTKSYAFALCSVLFNLSLEVNAETLCEPVFAKNIVRSGRASREDLLKLQPWTPSYQKVFWVLKRPELMVHLETFRLAKSSSQKSTLIKDASREFDALVKQLTKSSEYGIHFNLHGGTPEEYLKAGGILKTSKNPESYPMGNPHDFIPSRESLIPKEFVYFFSSKNFQMDSIINERPGFFKSRYGQVMIIFDLASLKQYWGDAIVSETSIQLEFALDQAVSRVAVPSQFFILPPLVVFDKTHELLGLKTRLSREEENYITLISINEMIASRITDH